MNRSLRAALVGNGLATVATVTLIVVIALAIVAPELSPWDFEDVDWDSIDTPPSGAHWFGTDGVGRDLFTRTFEGARLSLVIALAATSISMLIGIPFGATAGYLGGSVDQAMMRFVDMLYAIPFIFLVILLVVVFGRNIILLFAALGAVSWLDLARIVRGQTLTTKQEAFIDAARLQGLSQWQVIGRHIVPNVIGPAIVYGTLTIPGVILAESFISFLGLGVQEPSTSWGVLVADGAAAIHSSPWQLAFPAAVLVVTLLSFNILGDRLRDAFAPGTSVL